jgi:hypothetical protein
LRAWQPLKVVKHRSADLVKAAVGEFHFRLDADGPGDPPASELFGDVPEQCALADTGLAAQDKHAASAGESVAERSVKRVAFAAASQKGLRARTHVPGRSRSIPRHRLLRLQLDAADPNMKTHKPEDPGVPQSTSGRHGRDDASDRRQSEL